MPLRKPALVACFLCIASTVAAFDFSAFKLPAGFSISVYREGLPGARSLATSEATDLGAAVIVYVATENAQVYAVVDKDGDGQADSAVTLLTGLNTPNGVAWRGGALYVGEINRIIRLDGIDQYALGSKAYDKPPVVVLDSLPTDSNHGRKYLKFGADGKLYFPIGVPCNVCKPGTYQKSAGTPVFQYGTIYRVNPDGSGLELYASGIRNSVGFSWHPRTKKLFFTDNGRDLLGNNLPDDELNFAPRPGMFFGFPYCHTRGKGGADMNPTQRKPGVGSPIADPDLNAGQTAFPCARANFTQAAQAMGPHVAALGMTFYRWRRGRAFPHEFDRSILIAHHGSWNRQPRIGYRVMRAVLNWAGTRVVKYEPFVTGWLGSDGTVSGRPVDVVQLGDGSVLISDDDGGRLYRVTYQKPL